MNTINKLKISELDSMNTREINIELKNQKSKRLLINILLAVVVVVVAYFGRIQGFLETPPTLNWDESAVGVNAYYIANYGVDEWGYSFPLTFRSFGDDKNPVHIYGTALFVKFMGLTDATVRMPVLVLGVLNAGLLFFAALLLFKSRIAAFAAGISLAVSPYSIIFSHFNHELQFTIFFFLLGLIFFYLGLREKSKFLFLGFLFFAIDLLSYNSAKVVVPPVVCLLIALYFKTLWEKIWQFLAGVILFFSVVGLIFLNPHLSGVNRANQTSFSDSEIKETEYFKQTDNLLYARALLVKDQYLDTFGMKFLVESGDKNVRHSTQVSGEFYYLEGVLMLIGVLMLFILRSKEALILAVIILFAPIPSALFKESVHSGRTMFLVGSLHMLIGIGVWGLARGLLFVKEKFGLKIRYEFICGVILVPILFYYFFQLNKFLDYYVNEYPKRYAIEWQYGLREAADYINQRKNITKVYVTDSRSQPYIFFLFAHPLPSDEYLRGVVLDESKWNLSNSVEMYDKFVFGRWDRVSAMPTPGVIYVLTGSEYSGLMHKKDFDVKKLIRHPDGSEAFYVVEGI